jgi:hypothetical protein
MDAGLKRNISSAAFDLGASPLKSYDLRMGFSRPLVIPMTDNDVLFDYDSSDIRVWACPSPSLFG